MFQFQCPRCANLLQAEESHVGQQCHCPMCQTLFIIPAPLAQHPGPMPPVPAPPSSQTPAPASLSTPTPTPSLPPAPQSLPPTGPLPTPSPPPGVVDTPITPPTISPPPTSAPAEPEEPELLHIPCPECREVLEAPAEMLDQEVMCPHCQTQFQLRRHDSVEEREKRKRQREVHEQRMNNAWLYWSIAAVVLVLGFLLFLILSGGG